MVQEHKVRQDLYHHLNPNTSDMNLCVPYNPMSEVTLSHHVVDYFWNPQHVISYPSKSYAVAIIYGLMLQQFFNIPFIESLQDQHLLFDNDLHYVTYSRNPRAYDIAIRHIESVDELRLDIQHVKSTVDYFKEEFFITPNPYFDNANLS